MLKQIMFNKFQQALDENSIKKVSLVFNKTYYLLTRFLFTFQQFQSNIKTLIKRIMSKNKTPQPPKVEKNKPIDIKAETKKQSEVQKYMKQLSHKTISYTKVTKDVEEGQKGVLKSIKKGNLQVKQTPNDINKLITKEQINHQQIKANQLRKKRQQIISALQRLDMRNQKSNQNSKAIPKQYSHPQLLKLKPDGILTKQEHQALVEKIRQAQQIQDQRVQQRLYRIQKKIQQQEEQQKKMIQQKLISQKQLRRKRSEYKLSLRKKINDLQNAEQQRSKRQLVQLKKKNPLYQVLEQKYNNTVTIPGLQQKKKKLKQVRDLNKSFKMKQILQHEKKYMSQKSKSMQLSRSLSGVKVSQQWIYKPPQRTQKLKKNLEQELSNKKKELQKDKKAIQQKILRQDNYIRLLKEKYIPKVDQKLHQKLLQRINKIHTVKRQITVQPRQMGIKYLQQIKQMRREQNQNKLKNAQSKGIEQKSRSQEKLKIAKSKIIEQKSQLQSSRINYLKRNDSPQYYSQRRKQKVQKIIKSKKDNHQKTHELKIQNQKIQQAFKRKQQLMKIKGGNIETRSDAASLLLSGIQAKMGLIKLAN